MRSLIELATDPRMSRLLPPLASRAFLQRVTMDPKPITRREDGQLMLTALLRSGSEPGARVAQDALPKR
jgi:hypothetical protein